VRRMVFVRKSRSVQNPGREGKLPIMEWKLATDSRG
jgi:hypothetical protein